MLPLSGFPLSKTRELTAAVKRRIEHNTSNIGLAISLVIAGFTQSFCLKIYPPTAYVIPQIFYFV